MPRLTFSLDGYDDVVSDFREPSMREFQAAVDEADDANGLLETFAPDTDWQALPVRQYVAITRAARDFLVPDELEASYSVVVTS